MREHFVSAVKVFEYIWKPPGLFAYFHLNDWNTCHVIIWTDPVSYEIFSQLWTCSGKKSHLQNKEKLKQTSVLSEQSDHRSDVKKWTAGAQDQSVWKGEAALKQTPALHALEPLISMTCLWQCGAALILNTYLMVSSRSLLTFTLWGQTDLEYMHVISLKIVLLIFSLLLSLYPSLPLFQPV